MREGVFEAAAKSRKNARPHQEFTAAASSTNGKLHGSSLSLVRSSTTVSPQRWAPIGELNSARSTERAISIAKVGEPPPPTIDAAEKRAPAEAARQAFAFSLASFSEIRERRQ